MKHYSLILLLVALLLPAYNYAFAFPAPPCPCDTFQVTPDGPTGNEILAEVCPGGTLSPDATFVANQTELDVRIDDPRRGFRVALNNDTFECSITDSVATFGTQINELQFQSCRDTVVAACFNKRPIPTISEWGLIALAGVLGLVGIAVIRRKQAAA